VHEDSADTLVKELKKLVEQQKIGNPLDTNCNRGSLVAERQMTLLHEQYTDALAKGAKIVAQTEVPENLKGAFFPPTLLTNITKDMRVWQEEVFGPIFPIVTFKTEKESVELANDTPYGLTARVMSKDVERAMRIAAQIDAGAVSLNLESRFLPTDPFGGYKNSGMGRERGIHGLRELCQIKVIQENKHIQSGEA
jgi:acyl-CoA reductase-like NAD-dependent aldehyde dehydrogenase